jgi:DNA-binding CsgD family transcriptional regulator
MKPTRIFLSYARGDDEPFFAAVPVSGYASPASQPPAEVAPSAVPGTPAAEPQARLATLNPREREVARLFRAGRSTRDVACELRISLMTVETYRSRLMQKLGARSRVELQERLAAATDL